MYVPLPPVLTYRARAFVPEKVGTPEGKVFEQVLEAEWTALVFARWYSDIPQRGVMRAVSPRLRRNTNLGVENLLHGSRYALKDVQEWLREHDNYRWSKNSMLYQEKGGSIDKPAQLRRKLEFVREFPRYRVRLASGVVPIRGTWADFNEDTPPRDIAVYHTEDYMDQYAPVQPRLRSVPDTLLEARHPPTLLLRDIVSPSSGVREIPQTMLEKFREARVADCVQHYARWDLGQENTSVPVAVREEAVVSCIVSLLRAEKDLRAEVRELRAALDTVDERLVSSEERASKAEERGDLLARAYSVLENDAHLRKI
jgi:hypothetical protein